MRCSSAGSISGVAKDHGRQRRGIGDAVPPANVRIAAQIPRQRPEIFTRENLDGQGAPFRIGRRQRVHLLHDDKDIRAGMRVNPGIARVGGVLKAIGARLPSELSRGDTYQGDRQGLRNVPRQPYRSPTSQQDGAYQKLSTFHGALYGMAQ